MMLAVTPTAGAKVAPPTNAPDYITAMASTFKDMTPDKLAAREYNLQVIWQDKRQKTGAAMLILGTLAGLATAYAFTR